MTIGIRSEFEKEDNLIRVDNILDINREVELILKNRVSRKNKNSP